MSKAILLIGNYPPPFGGVPAHLQYLAPYLVEKGWNVYILSGGHPSGVHRKNGITVYNPKKSDILPNILSFLKELPKAFRFREYLDDAVVLNILGLSCLAKKMFGDKKISVISAYHILPQGFVGALLGEELRAPLVTTNFGEIYNEPSFYKRQTEGVRYVCDRSRKVLSVSNHCARSYSLLGLSLNVEAIPYGIDIKKFSPDNDRLRVRREYQIGERDKTVLFMGRIVRDMGVHTLIDAIPLVLERDKNIRFIIGGARVRGKKDLFEPLMRLKGMHEENVFIATNIAFAEQHLYYAASDIVVAPTLDNRACMGMSIKEAMASAKAVVASNIGGIPEAVVERETGLLIPPDDPEALAGAILELMENEEMTVRMGRRGMERAVELFDKEKTNIRIERIFSEIVASCGQPP